MRSHGRGKPGLVLLAALVWLFVAALAVVTTGQATSGSGSSAERLAPPATVTLVTGDRVTLVPSASGAARVIFDSAPRTERTGFDVRRDGSHVHVVPDDVASLVPDVLDPALFDVTALVEMGYDDRRADELPLIVRDAAGPRRSDDAPLQSGARLESIRATAAALDKDDAAEMGDDLAAIDDPARTGETDITRIWLDRRVETAALDGYLAQIKAPAAWGAGLDGAGVKVAVLDTGVDDGHPALTGQVDAHANFTDAASAQDGNGHGTHVASLVAGTGAGSEGARQGIATGADVLSGKVLADDGNGLQSWVIAGMEWAAAQGADVVNMSLGGPPAATDDPVVQSLDRLTTQTGALFVVAAGNRGGLGASPYTIETPGSAASALTVGAVTATDAAAVFSSEGPTLGTHRLKPEIAAPGVGIRGARAGARENDLYLPMSGTSQATPIVAGAAALLKQQHPNWSWRQIKAQLVGTADPHQAQTSWTHGGGRLDLDQATHQRLTADLATLDFGQLRHPDDAPKTRTVTLTNGGTEPVAIEISDQVISGSGVAAPAGALTADPATLTVPAGGTASTTVTLDPALLEDGLWQGAMSLSSAGSTLLRLPFGVYDEPERYDLDVQVLDRDGEPYDPATGAGDPNGDPTIPIFNGDTGGFVRLRPDANGRATARVEPGSYSIFARVITPAGNGHRDTIAIVGTPSLNVRADTRYVLDARDAERLDPPTIEGQETEPRVAVGITYSRHSDGGRGYTEFGFYDPQEVANGRVYITPTQAVTSGSFETTFRWRLAPTGTIKPAAPDAYDLLLNAPRFPAPLSPALTSRDVADLAEVDTAYRPVGPPGEYLAATVYQTVETGVGFVYRTPQQVPGSTRTLMTAAPDVLWGQCLHVPANANRELCDALHPYRRGERVAVQFGAGLRPEMVAARHSTSSMFLQTGIGDGGHRSSIDTSALDSSALTVYKDGELIARREAPSGFFPVPNEAGRFRVEQKWTLRDVFARSRQARTVWTVDSAPPADPSQGGSTTPPFMALAYDADADEHGRVAPRRPLKLALRAAPGRIESMRLWWSIDGGDSWQQSATRRTAGGSFDATVPGRALESGGSVSLRAVAIDEADNQVDQTVLGIYPVR